jgi:hypothetical protein
MLSLPPSTRPGQCDHSTFCVLLNWDSSGRSLLATCSRRQDEPEFTEWALRSARLPAAVLARTSPAPTLKRLLPLDEEARRLCRRLSLVPRVSSQHLSRSWVVAIEFRQRKVRQVAFEIC